MKSNFKRFMGIILAMLMIVTLLPVTAFAEDVEVTETVSAAFVVDGKTFYLMPDSTKTYNGKTYVGVYANTKEIPYADNKCPDNTNTVERIVLVPEGNRAAGGKYVSVSMSYTNPTNIQNKVTHFAPFGDYIIGSDYEWLMGSMYWKSTDSAVTPIYFKGSVGLPTSAELISLYNNDNVVNHGQSLATRAATDASVTGGAFWNRVRDGLSGNVSYTRVIDEETANITKFYSTMGAAWGYMTYISSDFFTKTKLDIDSMGSVVKEYLAANYIQDDFAGSDYTADELTALGVVAVPENPTPAHSPNYLKIVAANGTVKEFLYNDTITQNGKTYIGLIGTKDFWSHGSGYIGASFRSLMTAGVDFEGEALPSDSNWYLSTNRLQEWKTTKYHEIHTLMSNIPTAVQPYLLKYSYDCGQNSFYDGYKVHALRTIGKLTWVSKDEVEAHKTYLTPVAGNGTYIATRTGVTNDKHFYVYDKATDTFKSMGKYESPNGSLFMRMYVDADMLKTVKLDLSATRSVTKAMLKANFVRSDLEGIYTDAELDELGIESFMAEEKPEAVAGSSFVAGGKTFYYLNNTIDYNGKKYFRIFDKIDLRPWSKDAYYYVTERDDESIYVSLKHNNATELTSLSNNLDVFGDYKISADYEWNYGTATYDGATKKVYLKGAINVPSSSDYEYITKEVTFTSEGQMYITSTFFAYNNGTNRYVFNSVTNKMGKNAVTYNVENDYYVGDKSAAYNFVTYVSEDYFVNNELDLATTGEVMINAIKENFTRDELAAGGWSEATLDTLFNSGYTGEGLGLVAYKTGDESVAVVINNNDSVASTGVKLVVVAVYSEDGMEDVRLVNVTGNIPANSYTSKFPVTFDANGKEIIEIKVMLWDGIITAKPLAASVAIEN